VEFGLAVRLHRERALLSQAETARRAFVSGAHLSRIESGATCSRETARAIDAALHAGGTLLALHREPQPDPQVELHRESERLADLLAGARPGEVVDQLAATTDQLAVDYLAIPGPGLVDELATARREAVNALRARRMRHHHQIRDLTSHIGYLSGILSYTALDAGNPRAALAHAAAAWEAADGVDNNQLRAWIRGTQSLVLRFMNDYPEALRHADDGLRYATSGTGRARLLAGIGQCHANLGDARGARRALNEAETAHDNQRGIDEAPGLFTFSRAKLLYYSGSSLIWLDGGSDARRARDQAHTAIKLWETAGPERSIADESLAHVYAATASLQLGDLEEAADDLGPILSLPPHRRISWIVKRMDRIVSMLAKPPFDTSPAARDLLEQIRAYR
jgi:tetratricopeptide (TPR) repeat protein